MLNKNFKNNNHSLTSFKANLNDQLVNKSLIKEADVVELSSNDNNLEIDSILISTPLISKIEAADIETTFQNQLQENISPAEAESTSYLLSNYEKAKKFFLQKNYFNFKLNLTNQLNIKKSVCVFDELKYYLKDLKNHFQFIIEKKPTHSAAANDLTIDYKLFKLSKFYLEYLDKCIYLNEILLINSNKYDYDSSIQANGYRSLCNILKKCCEGTLLTMKQIYAQKSFFLSYMKYTLLTSELNDFEAWYNLIEKIEMILTIATELQLLSSKNEFLFVKNEDVTRKTQENILLLQSTYQEAFFGRTCCFQFCDSLKIPLTTFTIAMASYNDSYIKPNQSSLTRTAKSLTSGTKYFMNPELRGQKMANIMKTSNVAFCKFFSRLTDTPLFHVGANLTSPYMMINIVKTLDSDPLWITKFYYPDQKVKINPPYGISPKSPIRIRILSFEIREGMEKLDESLSQRRAKFPKSTHLILHVHGGGFISQSSKSHEVYLKPLCKGLNVPIVSVDYSLAPEHPFPKASEECFYAYIWCLLNKNKLGWTGQKIICVGDSAGGVLVTNIAQRSILFGIRAPDAIVAIYTPFLLTNSLSPSRLMSFMDPILNTGILWRSLAAYCGIELRPDDLNRSTEKLHLKNEEVEGIDRKFLINDNENEKQRVERLRKTFGNCYKLAEALKHEILQFNPYISPLMTEESILEKMPKMYLIACNDPFLDDNIEMAKLLRKHNREHELIIIDNGCSHAFLNMKNLCEETRVSFHKVYSVIEKILSTKF